LATIRRRGKQWHAQVRRVGAPTQTKTFSAKADAVEWARAVESSIDKGSPVEARNALKVICLGDLFGRYLREVSPLKRGFSAEAYRLGTMINSPLAQLSLNEVTHAALAAYRDQRLKSVSAATAKREFVIIRHCLEVAKTDWNIPLASNPACNIRIVGINSGRERRLKIEEEERLVTNAAKYRNPLLLPIVQFALATGMRRGEILNMLWDDVQIATRSLLIPHAKNGQARIIPLSRQALGVLEGLSVTGGQVFPMKPNALRLAWERLTHRSSISDLHFHDLRHEAISRFFEKGLSTPEVALISGHRDMRMLFRYTHPTRQRILDKLDCP
jgi:integrase